MNCDSYSDDNEDYKSSTKSLRDFLLASGFINQTIQSAVVLISIVINKHESRKFWVRYYIYILCMFVLASLGLAGVVVSSQYSKFSDCNKAVYQYTRSISIIYMCLSMVLILVLKCT